MIKIITYTITIFIMVFQVRGSDIAGSKELTSQCAIHYYQVVNTLLKYAKSADSKTEQFTELQNTIKEQQATIVKLNELIKEKDSQLKLQNELSDSYKSNTRNQQKLILQYENQITKQQAELNLKDNKINDLQSELKRKDNEISDLQSKVKEKDSELAVKTKKLEDKITAYQQKSSCFGKSTELHTIEVPKSKAQVFPVSCDSDLAGSGWIVIQRRMDGSVNFNRTWSEYREGFGNLSGEFFIGLEKLHLLTQSQPHELYTILQDFKNETRFARYSEFAIGSEDEFYELKTLGEYSGDAGDAMIHHKNTSFSTPDRDHDTHERNCAIDYSSGWWFNDCYMCNLNGPYVDIDTGFSSSIIEWRAWKMEQQMKFTQMMIKPTSF